MVFPKKMKTFSFGGVKEIGLLYTSQVSISLLNGKRRMDATKDNLRTY